MPRINKRKTNRIRIAEDIIQVAVNEILQNKSYRETAAKYNINISTLFKRVKKAKNLNKVVIDGYSTRNTAWDSNNDSSSSEETLVINKSIEKTKFGHVQIFNDQEEILLKKYLLTSSKICYGLTYVQTRTLTFEYACSIKKAIPDDWVKNKKSSTEWMKKFMLRHKDLSLKKPKNTSINDFFENYRFVLGEYKVPPIRIFIIDEIAITTESGEFVTFCGLMNAVGMVLPPVFVFPMVRYNESFLNGAPACSIGLASQTGTMMMALFVEVLKHIQEMTLCNLENPILLILDNHRSHISVESITYANENGIVILRYQHYRGLHF